MNVLLVTTGVPGADEATPDLGMGYLATSLRKTGHDVNFFDLSRRGHGIEVLERRLRENAFAMVAVKAFSSALGLVEQIVNKAKEVLPQSTIILGGPHPSCAPEHTMERFPHVDYACVGEGERCLSLLANQLAAGELDPPSIPGLVYRDMQNGKTVRINAPVPELDLDSLGFPAWDLMPPREYESYQAGYPLPMGRVPAPISVSRGCPYSCTFCTVHTIMGRRVRYRSPAHALDEIEMLVRDYGVDEIHIVDDLFTLKKDYVMTFCEGLKARNLNVRWAVPYGIRVDTITPELVRAMEESGCCMLALGIESANKRILDLMNKRLDVTTVREKVDLLRRNGQIALLGYFIIGYPTETPEEIERTIDFACSLPLQMAGFCTLRLTPGAQILEMAKEEGWTEFSWDDINVETIWYHPTGISFEELMKYRRKAYLKFYFHRKRLPFLLRRCTSLRNIVVLLRLGKRRAFPARSARAT
jgi:anaerobic magnesium-protoporphyrin IX monomethyl ester cyclase